MRVAFFSTKSYDKQSFDHLLPDYKHEVTYFEPKLDRNTVALAKDHDAIFDFILLPFQFGIALEFSFQI